MKQSWIKLGKVFCPCGQNDLLYTHATNPVAEHLSQNRYRVYFSSRDKHNRGQIASIEIEIENQTVKVCENTLRHVLSHGKNGYFDDNGVTVTGFLHRNSKFIYTIWVGIYVALFPSGIRLDWLFQRIMGYHLAVTLLHL